MKTFNLRKFYGTLAVISSLFAVQSMILPRWPEASKLSDQGFGQLIANLVSKGHVLTPLPNLPSARDYNLSHTPIAGLSIDSKSELRLTNVQVRDRKDLSVSHILKSIKPLKLGHAATQSNHPPIFNTLATDDGNVYQTCFVPNSPWPGGFNLDQFQLTAAVDQFSSSNNISNVGIKRFLGLLPSRKYECILITLKTSLTPQESSKLWAQVLGEIQAAFH